MSDHGLIVEDGLGNYGPLLIDDSGNELLTATELAREDYADGATIYELLNGPGTATIRSLADGLPVVGDAWGRYADDTKVHKSTSTLPGAVNGGSALDTIFWRFYVKLCGGNPFTTSRIFVVEEDVADGGDDIAGIRCHADFPDLSLGDGSSYSATKSARRLSTVAWTRCEWRVSRTDDDQELRIFHGDQLNAPHWDYNERLTHTVTSNIAMQVWGLGYFLGSGASSAGLGFDFAGVAVGSGNWLGPVDGARSTRGRFSSAARLEVPIIGASA